LELHKTHGCVVDGLVICDLVIWDCLEVEEGWRLEIEEGGRLLDLNPMVLKKFMCWNCIKHMVV